MTSRARLRHRSQLALTAEQMRRADDIAINRFGIPVMVLMDHAGRAVAEEARRMVGPADERTILILSGGGNNGGDGVAAARYLQGWGYRTKVLWLRNPESWSGHLAVHFTIARRMGVQFAQFDRGRMQSGRAKITLVIDALLGTGSTGELREGYPAAIEAINASGKPVVAVDIPSGMDTDTGASRECVVRADVTVTMAAPKVGLLKPAARPFTGRLVVADIGIPAAALSAAQTSRSGG